METVFSNKNKDLLKDKPFPHLVSFSAIDSNIVDRLIEEFPSMEVVSKGSDLGNNKRFSLPAKDVEQGENISKLWKDFIASHVTQDCWLQILSLFAGNIRSQYPDLEKKVGRKLEDFRVGVRYKDDFDKYDILLDAQICINSPVKESASSVKITHVDNENKLFGGLLYLRKNDDDSKGGNLEISVFRGKKIKFHGPRLVDNSFVETINIIEYKKNTLIYFLNSINSLHGVTNREPTKHPRLFMNLVAVVKDDLFSLKKYQSSKIEKIWNKIKNKLFNK